MNSNNRSDMIGKLKSAAAISFSGTFVALLICTYLLNGDLFNELMPLWLTIAFCALCFMLERLPLMHKHKWLKVSLQVMCVILAGVLLKVC